MLLKKKKLGMYICMHVNGIHVKKILIDISSNINFCYVNFLKMYFSSIHVSMRRTTVSIKGFDNSEK